MDVIKFALLLVATFCVTVESSRILAIVPTASFSHQVFFQPLWKELARRGHEVTLLTTDPIRDPTLKTLKEIDLSDSYKSWNASVMGMVTKNDDKLELIHFMMEVLYNITEVQLQNPEVQALYHSNTEQFDLIILEYLLPTMCIFKHKFKAPLIGITSMDAPGLAHSLAGNPTHSVLYPNPMMPFGDELTFFERLAAVSFERVLELWGYWTIYPRLDNIVRETLGEGIPSVMELMTDVDMIFANANPLFNAVRPYTPATINLAGGLHESEAKKLPVDLEEFLGKSEEGVVYFSLGSNVKSKDIDPRTRQIIMDTFKQLPYKVLWKFEDDQLPGKPENVKIMKWLPQQDVLRHKNVKLFVTQAGLQSLEESLYARVPLVALPFFADQEANARRMESKGLGIQLDHKTLTVEQFKSAILKVMTDDSYRLRVKKMADMIQDQPMKPLEKAVWWVEYVLRHKGAKHLHGPRIPFYQRFYLDILTFLGVVLSVIFGLLFLICRIVYQKIRSYKKCNRNNDGSSKNKKIN